MGLQEHDKRSKREQHRIRDLRQEAASLKRKNGECIKEIEHLEKKRDKLQREIAKLEDTVKRKSLPKDDGNLTRNLKEKIKNLEHINAQKEKLISEQQHEIELAKRLNRNVPKGENSSLGEDEEHLTLDESQIVISNYGERISRLGKELFDSKEENKHLCSVISDLKIAYRDRNDRISALQIDLENLKSEEHQKERINQLEHRDGICFEKEGNKTAPSKGTSNSRKHCLCCAKFRESGSCTGQYAQRPRPHQNWEYERLEKETHCRTGNERDVEQLQRKLRGLFEKIQSKEAELREKEEANYNLEKSVAHVKAANVTLLDAIEKKEGELNAYTENFRYVKYQLYGERFKYHKISEQFAKKLLEKETELRELQKQLEEGSTQKQTVVCEMLSLQKENEVLKTQIRSPRHPEFDRPGYDKLKREYTISNSLVQRLTEENKNLSEENSKLQQELQSSKEYSVKNEMISNKIKDLTTENEKLKQNNGVIKVDLASKIREKETVMQTLEQVKNDCKHTEIFHTQEVDRLKRRCKDLEESRSHHIAEKENEVERLTAESKALKQQIHCLERDRESHRDKEEQLSRKLDGALSKLTADEENTRLLSDRNTALTTKLTQCHEENEELKKAVISKENDIQYLQNKLDTEKRDKLSSVLISNQHKTDDEILKREIQRLREENRVLESKVKALEKEVQTKSTTRKEIEKINSRLDKECERLANENKTLSTALQLEQSEKVKTQSETSQRSIELDAQLQRITKENEMLREKITQTENLTKELSLKSEEILHITAVCSQQKEEVEKLRQEIKYRNEMHAKKTKDQEMSLDAMKSVNANMKSDNEERIAYLNAKLEKLLQENEELKDERTKLDRLRTELDLKDGKILQMSEISEKLQQTLNSFQEKYDRCEEQNRKLKDLVSKKEDITKDIKCKIDKLNLEHKHIMEKNESLQAQLKSQEDLKVKLNNDGKQLAHLKTVQKGLEQLRKREESLQTELDRKVVESNELRKENILLRDNVERMKENQRKKIDEQRFMLLGRSESSEIELERQKQISEDFRENVERRESENHKLRKDVDSLKEALRYVTENRRQKEEGPEHSLSGRFETARNDLEQHKSRVKCFEEEVKRQEKENHALRQENDSLRNTLNCTKENTRKEKEKHEAESKILIAKIEGLKKEFVIKESDIKSKNALIQRLEGDLQDVNQQCVDHIKYNEVKKQLEQSNTVFAETRSVVDEKKTRQRKHDQGVTDNTNITYLSDQNRPTKLAERYIELYDNQWTDAYEIIDNGNDKTTVRLLLDILMETMKFCGTEADRQLETLGKAVTLSDSKEVARLPDVLYKELKNWRKEMARDAGKNLYEERLAYIWLHHLS